MEELDLYYKRCRLCACENALNIQLFSDEGRSCDLISKIGTCLGLRVSKNDGMPQLVCYQCLYEVESFHNFKLKCQDAEHILKNWNSFFAGKTPEENVDVQPDSIQLEEELQKSNGVQEPSHSQNTNKKTTQILSEKNNSPQNNNLLTEVCTKKPKSLLNENIYKIRKLATSIENTMSTKESNENESSIKKLKMPDSSVMVTKINTTLCKTLKLSEEDYNTIAGHVTKKSTSVYKKSNTLEKQLTKPKNGDESDRTKAMEREKTGSKSKKTGKKSHLNGGSNVMVEIIHFDYKNPNYVGKPPQEVSSGQNKEELDSTLALMRLLEDDFNELDEGMPIENSEKKSDSQGLSVATRSSEEDPNSQPKVKPEKNSRNKENDHANSACESNNNEANVMNGTQRSPSRNSTQEVLKMPLMVGIKKKMPLIPDFHVKTMKTESGKIRFMCFVCQKDFASKVYLKEHMKIHSGERSSRCPICSRAFRNKFMVRAHMLTHDDVRSYKCNECGKAFKQQYNLITHKKLHSNNDPFCCKFCDAKFKQKVGLIRHMRIRHTGEKPYKCKVCDMAFSDSSRRSKHARKHMQAQT